jgi:ABC-type iron transport system FetAB ATPase subunit
MEESVLNRLRVDSVTYHHRGPVSVSVGSGECVSLTGPSGVGKTLLLRALADLDPHEGSVFLDDVESQTVDAPTWRRMVGLLPAESQWWFDIVGPHFPAGVPAGLGDIGFDGDVMKWTISRLSTGERQRLSLLRLLENRPRALLLDEPTASLDTDNVALVERLIARFRRETQAAVLWVTHDPDQARRIADRHFELSEAGLVEKR